MENTTLDMLSAGDLADVVCINTKGNMRRRFLDIGLCCNTRIKCVLNGPGKKINAYLIKGAVIAIRNVDSKSIIVKML